MGYETNTGIPCASPMIRWIAQDVDLNYVVIKLNKECTKIVLEMNIKNIEYMSTGEESKADLKIDKYFKIRGTEKFKYIK